MLSFDEAVQLIQSQAKNDFFVQRFNSVDKEFLKISSVVWDPFLKEIPPCYMIMSLMDEDGPPQLNLQVFSYKRSKIKEMVFEAETVNDFLETLTKLKPCQGIAPEKVSLIKSSDILSEMFDSRLLFRHRNCHIVVENGQVCEFCSPSSKRKKAPSKPVFQCEVCDLDFASKILLNQHHRRNHSTKSKKWICKFDGCQKSFKRSETLKNHLRTHENGITFACQLCNEKFTRKGTLTAHIRRTHDDHDESKSWTCADCPKLFFTRQQLERHRRIHVGDKPYNCQECNKSFSRSHHLSRHTKSLHAPNDNFTLEYEVFDDQGKHHTVIQLLPKK